MSRFASVMLAVALLSFPLLVSCADDGAVSTKSAGAPTSIPIDSRLIVLTMTDDAFTPSAITATAGETVTLRFINKGTVRHEAVVGDETVQLAHAEMMMSMTTTTVVPRVSSLVAPRVASLVAPRTPGHPGMNAPNVVSVEAGATGEVTYSLAKPANLLIGCHEPGHYEHGMVATLTVV